MSRTRRCAALLAAVGACVTLLLAGMPARAFAAPVPSAAGLAAGAGAALDGPVIFVGTGGVSWSDVSPQRTPALWSMLRGGATATVTVRSVRTTTCPVDGWLSLSAGQRAGDIEVPSSGGVDNRPPCEAVAAPVGGRVGSWATYRQAAADQNFGARLGLVADQVAVAGGCVQAVGPGAALGAARSDGTVARYTAYEVGNLGGALSACPLAMVDVGGMRDPAEVRAEDAVQPRQLRAEQVAGIDARIGQVLAAAPTGSTVLVGSLSDAGNVERLRLAAMTGPRIGPGSLVSLSTRQPGLIQAADLTATILSRLELPEAAGVSGRPLRAERSGAATDEGAQDRLTSLVDDDLASHEVHALVPPFFNGWVIAQIVIYAFVAVVWRRRWGSTQTRLRLLRTVQRVGVAAAAVPVSTFLANLLPWWRFPSPLLGVVGSVALFVAALSALALLGPWRRSLFGPLAVVTTGTLVVLAADVMTGSRLQLSSLMGLQPVVGGRFYGMGNVTFALFATAALLLCIAVGDALTRRGRRRLAAAAVGTVGLGAALVDGWPAWGADFGGPPALLPGVAVLTLAVLQVRLTWRKALLVLGGTVGFLLLLSVADWLRPAESRSHLGNFVQSVIDGGAYAIVARKAAQNVAILTGSWLTLLVPFGLAFVVYILARPTSWGSQALQRAYERAPLLRPGLVALLVTMVIGFALNDSGTAIPAVAGTLAIPLIIALCVQTLLDEQRAIDDATPALPAQPRPATPAVRHRGRPGAGSPG